MMTQWISVRITGAQMAAIRRHAVREYGTADTNAACLRAVLSAYCEAHGIRFTADVDTAGGYRRKAGRPAGAKDKQPRKRR